MFRVISTSVSTPSDRSDLRRDVNDTVRSRVAWIKLVLMAKWNDPSHSGGGSFSVSRVAKVISGQPLKVRLAAATRKDERSVKTYSKGIPSFWRRRTMYWVVPLVPAPTSRRRNLPPPWRVGLLFAAMAFSRNSPRAMVPERTSGQFSERWSRFFLFSLLPKTIWRLSLSPVRQGASSELTTCTNLWTLAWWGKLGMMRAKSAEEGVQSMGVDVRVNCPLASLTLVRRASSRTL